MPTQTKNLDHEWDAQLELPPLDSATERADEIAVAERQRAIDAEREQRAEAARERVLFQLD